MLAIFSYKEHIADLGMENMISKVSQDPDDMIEEYGRLRE